MNRISIIIKRLMARFSVWSIRRKAHADGLDQITDDRINEIVKRSRRDKKSKLDVHGIDTGINRQDVVDSVREGREMDINDRHKSYEKKPLIDIFSEITPADDDEELDFIHRYNEKMFKNLKRWNDEDEDFIKHETEIVIIRKEGFYILIDNSKYFIPFERYPKFMTATIAKITNFTVAGTEINWPDLDVDIDIDALKHPEKYPLIYTEQEVLDHFHITQHDIDDAPDVEFETPTVVLVEALDNKLIGITFDNGIDKIYDCSKLIELPRFQLLKDDEFFKSVSVDVGGHGVSWNDDVDLSEYELWTNGKTINSTTIGAIRDAKHNKNLTEFNETGDLFDDLNI